MTVATPTKSSIVRDHTSLTPTQKKDTARIERICSALASKENIPAWAKTILQNAGPAISAAMKAFDAAMPYMITFFTLASAFYESLPTQALTALYGLAICFFGGHFTVSLAAAEAFRVSGGDRVGKALEDLYDDWRLIKIANAVDNKKDDDADGVADVDQLSGQQLISRKLAIVLRNVNPDRCLQAIGALAQAFAGVVATLKLQFARTVITKTLKDEDIALAVSISDNIKKPAGIILSPILAALIPRDYHHWVSPIITIACKVVGLWIAWALTRVIATCHASMLGGLMAARALFALAASKGLITTNIDDSMIDEICGWALCVMGVFFQLSNFLTLPFPLNLVLFPLSVLEWFLTWAVTWFD